MSAIAVSLWMHLFGPPACGTPQAPAELAPMPRLVPVMRTLPVGPPRIIPPERR